MSEELVTALSSLQLTGKPSKSDKKPNKKSNKNKRKSKMKGKK